MIRDPEVETAPRERIQALQAERLGQALAWAAGRVPFYREALRAAGIAPGAAMGLDRLQALPFTEKEHLRQHYPFGLFAVPRGEVRRLHASSGTRGKPTVVGYTQADLALWREVMARSLAVAGVAPGDCIMNSYGYKGVNVYPSQLEAALLTLPDLAPHYQLVVDRAHAFPRLAVHVEPAEPVVQAWGGFDSARAEVVGLAARAAEVIRGHLGLNPEITIVPPKTIPRSEGKAARVVERS